MTLTGRVRPFLAFVALAVLASAGSSGCGGPTDAPSPTVAAAVPTASTPAPTVDAGSRHPTCSAFVYPTLRTTRISVAAGACLSFEHYSDIAAVITGVRPADAGLFQSLDALTYRGLHAGSTVFSVDTKREICTATATCQVPNPVKRLTVTVTKAG